jgi:hypothetical protein
MRARAGDQRAWRALLGSYRIDLAVDEYRPPLQVRDRRHRRAADDAGIARLLAAQRLGAYSHSMKRGWSSRGAQHSLRRKSGSGKFGEWWCRDAMRAN